jgi:hypothetical protein
MQDLAEISISVIRQAGFDSKKADCRLNWGMPEKPDVETFLYMLLNIGKGRPAIICLNEQAWMLIETI